MAHCHQKAIILLEEFIKSMTSLGTKRALEVAAGDGQASRDLLQNFFEAIDCFDQCPNAIKQLEMLQDSIKKIQKVDQATMQSFFWEELYDCILLRWCVGYLGDEELIVFLNQAIKHLNKK